MTERDLVIVTGTSGGLGGAIVRRLVAADYDVVGVARRDVTTTSTSATVPTAITIDVSIWPTPTASVGSSVASSPTSVGRMR